MSLREAIRIKKSKYQDIVLISAYSYPPTTNRDSLIRDDLDFIFPPTLLIEIGTFLLSKFHFGISLLFSLYLRHGFCSESEQPDGNRVKERFKKIEKSKICGHLLD